jgi:hypothetical protein
MAKLHNSDKDTGDMTSLDRVETILLLLYTPVVYFGLGLLVALVVIWQLQKREEKRTETYTLFVGKLEREQKPEGEKFLPKQPVMKAKKEESSHGE